MIDTAVTLWLVVMVTPLVTSVHLLLPKGSAYSKPCIITVIQSIKGPIRFEWLKLFCVDCKLWLVSALCALLPWQCWDRRGRWSKERGSLSFVRPGRAPFVQKLYCVLVHIHFDKKLFKKCTLARLMYCNNISSFHNSGYIILYRLTLCLKGSTHKGDMSLL